MTNAKEYYPGLSYRLKLDIIHFEGDEESHWKEGEIFLCARQGVKTIFLNLTDHSAFSLSVIKSWEKRYKRPIFERVK